MGPVSFSFRSGVLTCWLLVWPAIASAQTLEEIDFFEMRVRPVLAENCFACHSGQTQQPMSGLRVDTRDALLQGGDRGPAVVPGQPSESRLIQAVRRQGLIDAPGREARPTIKSLTWNTGSPSEPPGRRRRRPPQRAPCQTRLPG